MSKPEVFSQSFWMLKLINKFMKKGKKFKVENAILSSFSKYKLDYPQSQPFFILFKYLLSYRPLYGFVKIRKSRQYKQIPMPLSPKRQMIICLTWFVRALRMLKEKKLIIQFYEELKNIKTNTKPVLKRYKVTHEFHFQIVTERINVRYRWK